MSLKTTLRDPVRGSGERLARKAERASNRVGVPVARKLDVGDLVRQTAVRMRKDQLHVYAGHLAFRSLFALFPSLLAFLWVLQLLHARRMVGALVDLIGTALPEATATLVRDQVTASPGDQARGAVTFWAVLSVVVAFWAIAGLFRATMDGLNAVYAVEESRPAWKRYAIGLSLGLAVAVLLMGALVLIVLGAAGAREAGERTALGGRVLTQGIIWSVLLAFVLAATALTNYFAPDVQQRFRWISTGAIVSAVLWLLFSALYSLYINHIANYNQLYGALAGLVLLMAYVYASSFILLLGAEINQVIETSDPAGKDEGERVPGRGVASA